jgi:predicted TIM-barrel fold metal-dependent hydrolase
MNDLSGGLRELEALIGQRRISGIKLYPGYQRFNPGDECVVPVYQLAQANDLPVMFHTGELHHCCPREERERGHGHCGDVCWIDRLQHLSHPEEMLSPVRAFPEVRFVLSHLGNPHFEALRRVMQECPNVYTDISGQFLSGTEEDSLAYREELRVEMMRFLEIDGAVERIMFGTDFPIQSYQDSLALVEALGLSQDEEEKVLYRNAVKLLKLQ